jgi:hypothetical protein
MSARKYGTRHEVFDLGTAVMTRGGLKKDDLMLSRTGKIVSKRKSEAAAANYKLHGFAKRVEAPPPEEKKRRVRRQRKKTVEL